jgi:hypothetical protein
LPLRSQSLAEVRGYVSSKRPLLKIAIAAGWPRNAPPVAQQIERSDPRRPFPCWTRSSMHLLSMSDTFSETTSEPPLYD